MNSYLTVRSYLGADNYALRGIARFGLDSPSRTDGTNFRHGETEFKSWGWISQKEGESSPEVVVLQEGKVLHAIRPGEPRPWVAQQLEKSGVQTNKNNPIGFSMMLPLTQGKLSICFRIDKRLYEAYLIEIENHRARSASSLMELLHYQEGTFENIYFRDNADWSKIIIMFNGAVTRRKAVGNGPTFQRWSWARQFKHPVLCIADPLTYGQSALELGWYHGHDGTYLQSFLESLLEQIARAKGRNSSVITFGSSAGGYAALLAWQLGFSDLAVAINPQTDINLFESAVSVDRFYSRLKKHAGFVPPSSLVEKGFSGVRRNSILLYLQNMHDRDHFWNHARPYFSAVGQSTPPAQIISTLFSDEGIGHNPPDLKSLSALLGYPFKQLLG